MGPFDLIEFQQRALTLGCPKKLYALWEDVSGRYERGEIGKYERDEMKDVIWPQLKQSTHLKNEIDSIENK